jgi:soluble lytic murein transglycosylase
MAADRPAEAALALAAAGPGPVLEEARFSVWLRCLEASSAPAPAYRAYLAAGPPPELAASARLALLGRLVATGELAAAAAERELLPAATLAAADEVLLAAPAAELRLAAARRLATSSPRRLAARASELERRLLAGLAPGEWLERARAWQREGSPARAAAELRRLRWQGPLEGERRRELARAELAAGSPRAALAALPEGGAQTPEDLVLRARAHRTRAWQLYPGRGATAAFADCAGSAAAARASAGRGPEGPAALELELECATEAGRLDAAFEAWRALAAGGWSGDRREWLGRRLGVALVLTEGGSARVRELERSLPAQARCLRFWIAADSPDGRAALLDLAEVRVGDLYARWARELARATTPAPPSWSEPLAPASPPASVALLLEAGAAEEALRQWARARRLRPPAPAEALAAAELAAATGDANGAISWLRAGFPELGTVEATAAPANAALAYLPLRWREALAAAAAESGVEPWVLAALARQESVFTAGARSPRGALGVLQLLPSTARGHARALGLGERPELRDPELNLRLGARELARLHRRFGELEPALAAYNAGETRVRGWRRRQPDHRRFTEAIPIPETYTYVRRVSYLAEAYRLLYAEAWRTPS